MAGAAALVRPRVTLPDTTIRDVLVQNLPADALPNVPELLSHKPQDSMGRREAEPVGRLQLVALRDARYRLADVTAANALSALLRDDLEPTVVVRRFRDGRRELLAVFDSESAG